MRFVLVLSVALAGCMAQSTSGDTPPPPTSPKPTGEQPVEQPPAVPGAQGQACGANEACIEGTACLSYYGVAGPSGPQFTSCEIRCGGNVQCPDGQGCTTIADGPGQVCRPMAAQPAAGKQGQKCGENDACESGTTCVKYYGIAGAKGPQFTSCEIKCSSNKQCPSGQACTTIADGPGQVCR